MAELRLDFDPAPYHLLTSIVAPRPIAWVSTISAEGVPNLAPYSSFNTVAGFPPTLMFSVMVLGQVVRFHVRKDLYRAELGLVDTIQMQPITRLGGAVEYTKIGELFFLELPKD